MATGEHDGTSVAPVDGAARGSGIAGPKARLITEPEGRLLRAFRGSILRDVPSDRGTCLEDLGDEDRRGLVAELGWWVGESRRALADLAPDARRVLDAAEVGSAAGVADAVLEAIRAIDEELDRQAAARVATRSGALVFAGAAPPLALWDRLVGGGRRWLLVPERAPDREALRRKGLRHCVPPLARPVAVLQTRRVWDLLTSGDEDLVLVSATTGRRHTVPQSVRLANAVACAYGAWTGSDIDFQEATRRAADLASRGGKRSMRIARAIGASRADVEAAR